MSLLLNPAVLLVIFIFLAFIGILIYKVKLINKQLNILINVFKSFDKNNLIYHFQELNQQMMGLPFIADYWSEFKSTLIFGDKLASDSSEDILNLDSLSKNTTTIYCISSANYFFNEETLIYNVLNHKLISSIPGILTGLGPLGTFLYIAIGFSGVDFSSEETTVSSITNLLSNMEIAAVISILAISSALSFIIIDRILYYFMCQRVLDNLQLEINKLFDNISTEQFLTELVKETQKQNKILNSYAGNFSGNLTKSLDNSIQTNIVPYLENIVFGLNQQKEMLSKDMVNKLLEQ